MPAIARGREKAPMDRTGDPPMPSRTIGGGYMGHQPHCRLSDRGGETDGCEDDDRPRRGRVNRNSLGEGGRGEPNRARMPVKRFGSVTVPRRSTRRMGPSPLIRANRVNAKNVRGPGRWAAMRCHHRTMTRGQRPLRRQDELSGLSLCSEDLEWIPRRDLQGESEDRFLAMSSTAEARFV